MANFKDLPKSLGPNIGDEKWQQAIDQRAKQ
jgi:hypothetical protein